MGKMERQAENMEKERKTKRKKEMGKNGKISTEEQIKSKGKLGKKNGKRREHREKEKE